VKSVCSWTGAGFQTCTGKGVRFAYKGVMLRRGITIADELGRCNNRDREEIFDLRIAMKQFQVGRLALGTAKLCPYLECDRPGGMIEICINDHVFTYTWRTDRPYWKDRWTPIDVPTDWLHEGENDVVFRSMDESVWTLLIESSRQPNRSAVSEDDGQTWRKDDLGWNNGCDGEYMVRLWLDQYPNEASIESDVVDLLRDPSRDIGVSANEHTACFEMDVDTTHGSSAQLNVRFGSTPTYSPRTWSAWAPMAMASTDEQRFGQWQVVLTTEDPGVSPVLRAVYLNTNAREMPGLRVVQRSEPALRRSSYRFSSARHDEPRADRLRDRWHLDEVVRGSGSEWEDYINLRQWVRNQWEDGWDTGEIDFCPPWDAMLILELTSRNLSLGMCTHYATVMSQCCAALGLNARTQIMKSHCINEVWSTDHQKWVAMDVGGDNDDETKFVYHFEREGVPLSAGECHSAWVAQEFDDVTISPPPPPATGERYNVDKRLQLFERFMISMRTDELRSLEPGESEHGKGSYHYDGYLFWEDEQTEALPWFSNHTSRSSDLYWSVNETYIHLLDGSPVGSLEVLLESATPNLAGFERSADGESWAPCDEGFKWVPATEGQCLKVRSVNHFGRSGVVSVVEVAGD
jgi:hypothetical protein